MLVSSKFSPKYESKQSTKPKSIKNSCIQNAFTVYMGQEPSQDLP